MDGTARHKHRCLTPMFSPVPEVLNALPRLYDQRPRGTKAMIDARSASTIVRGTSWRLADQSLHWLEMGKMAKW